MENLPYASYSHTGDMARFFFQWYLKNKENQQQNFGTTTSQIKLIPSNIIIWKNAF